jgi:hypothetical protein
MQTKLSKDEFADILRNKSKCCLILDARYQKEYQIGHIKGAINIRNKEQFLNLFETYDGNADYVVVHCEFSQYRGPSLINFIMKYDERLNSQNLLFPKVSLLIGGYSAFYQSYPDLCDGGYYPEFLNSGTEKHFEQTNERSKLYEFIFGKPEFF